MPAALNTRFTVAVAQASAGPQERAASLEQARELVMDASQAGARLVVLPEAFVPGYPHWVWTTPLIEAEALAARRAELLATAVTVPSEITDRLARIAQRASASLVIGVCERCDEPGGIRLFNTLLFFDGGGHLVGRQRQLVPASAERLAWGAADGSTLQVHQTSAGAIGGLLGADNCLPLARYVLYAAGAEIYVAAGSEHGEPWPATLRHIAREGRLYVIGCGTARTASSAPQRGDELGALAKPVFFTGSIVVSPEGDIIAGPSQAAVGLLYADIDLERLAAARRADPDGPLARPDIFQLSLRSAMSPMPTLQLAENLRPPRSRGLAPQARADAGL